MLHLGPVYLSFSVVQNKIVPCLPGGVTLALLQ